MLTILAALALGQAPTPAPLENLVLKLRNAAAADVAAAIKKSASGQPFVITPEPATNSLLISASAADVIRFVEQVNKLDAPPEQVFISATVCEGDPLGSKAAGTLKVLGEPKLMVTNLGTGAFRVAGQPEAAGVMCQVRVEKKDGKVRLRVTTELTTVQKVAVTTPGVRDVTTTGVTKTDAELELRDGETTRLRIAPKAEKETWVELRVDVVR